MSLSYAQARNRLEEITQEMLDLIAKYQLDAQSPFDVISMAREKITSTPDYIRFLELSLEGRIYGEYADALQKDIDRQSDETTPPTRLN